MKKKLYFVAGLLLMLFVSACSQTATQTQPRLYVIDPGHGGRDPGAIREDIHERDIVFSIAMKIKQLYEEDDDKNIRIVFTRNSDFYLPLNERVEIGAAFQPNLMLGLHVDITSVSDTPENGITPYISDRNAFAKESETMAQALLDYFAASGLAINPIESANFVTVAKATFPSILFELGFLNNVADRALLTSEEGQNEMAKAIYNGLKTL